MTEASIRIKKLKNARLVCLSDLSILHTLGTRVRDEPSVRTLFKVRCENELDALKEEFSKAHQNILSSILSGETEGDLENENSLREGFYNDFYKVKTFYQEFFEQIVPSTQPNVNNSRNIGTSGGSNAKLPKIELPKFKGDYKMFATFNDLFLALVHNNTTLTDIEKFNYLVASLEGQPLTIVRSLPMTAENYNVAYRNFTERYSNKRLRAQAHWKAIEQVRVVEADNPNSLRYVLDTFNENLAALKNLNFPTDQWDFILVNMLLKKLDSQTVTKFELQHGTSEIPKYQELITFLNKCCTAYDTLSYSVQKKSNQFHSNAKNRTNSFFVNRDGNGLKCLLCNDQHLLYNCSSFANKTPHERFNFAKSYRLCLNCLSDIHSTQNCKSKQVCRKCSKRHHSLLHFISSSSQPPVDTTARTQTQIHADNEGGSIQTFSASSLMKNSAVLLSTALIEVQDKAGNFQQFRCLLDSGSMSSFITQKAAHQLMLPKQKCFVEIKGLGNANSIHSNNGSVLICFRSLKNPHHVLTTDAIILNQISNDLPASKISCESWEIIKNLNLADPKFNIPGKVDFLLGADVYSKLLLNGHISGRNSEPDAINTILGFVLLGNFAGHSPLHVQSYFCNAAALNHTMQQFWETESIPESTAVICPEDKICEQHFLERFSQDASGKYIVSLPFRESEPRFSGIRTLAHSRFLSLERRLLKQPQLHLAYSAFLKEYLDLGHMESIEESVVPEKTFYIPHHCILRPDSSTTSLRVVFNGSAHLPNQPSLNDVLFKGPKLQADIIAILLQFRLHRFVLCADVKMMYRNILVNRSDCDYQRILWRFSPDDPVADYRLLTVVYGLKPSPFLALRTLKQLVHDHGTDYPLASQAILKHTYVDDVVTGASNVQDAENLRDQLSALFAKGGFQLRKWSSNDVKLLSKFKSEDLLTLPLSFQSQSDHATTPKCKVLGLQWCHSSDCFLFCINMKENVCTKRTLLSELAKIFDPLGFLAPITFFTKNLIQQLWLSGVGWDEAPPDYIIQLWDTYKMQLPYLNKLKIPRYILSSRPCTTYELHGFCDSSERGYAAVVYLRILQNNTHFSNYFISSKTKVASLKKLTIPRLELCAAVLLVKLLVYITEVYKNLIEFVQICAWSDSEIALHWICGSPHRWKTFVSHRVAYIQEHIPPCNWYYVATNNNPADIGSRGALPKEFLNNRVWLHGPEFLSTFNASSAVNFVSRSSTKSDLTKVAIEEKRISLFACNNTPNLFETLLEKYSSFTSCQRVLAYVQRFVFNLKNKLQKRFDALDAQELNKAVHLLVKYTQTLYFQEEMSSKRFSKPLKKLDVFTDDEGILRVGGRLKLSSLSYDKKFPILLPQKSRLTWLIIDFFHKKYLHAGLRTLHFLISQNYWILAPKRAIRSVLSKCITCWKMNPKPFQPKMGDLPPPRISQAKAFLHTGVDFGGPFNISMSRHRGVRTSKAYICLFVCLATKALHLELASDLSSEIFLAALQRFLARRGRCATLYSDCGTNFVGAYKQIRRLMQNVAEKEQISWRFNPPSAPHFGGLWEAGIKAVKSHLARIIGQQILSYEEFYTLLTLIESILNSRPLTPMSSDLDDLNALTPGHFLTTEPISVLPQSDVPSLSKLTRWKLLQRLHQDFWHRYNLEYLHTLQQRSKWLQNTNPPKIGTLVLIKNENLPALQWPLGRIISLSPGPDGVPRVATLKTVNGTLQRPLVKLCPLPTE